MPTLTRSVEPLTPSKVPAVSTTRSPSRNRPFCRATPMARVKVLAVEGCSGISRGLTPQTNCS